MKSEVIRSVKNRELYDGWRDVGACRGCDALGCHGLHCTVATAASTSIRAEMIALPVGALLQQRRSSREMRWAAVRVQEAIFPPCRLRPGATADSSADRRFGAMMGR